METAKIDWYAFSIGTNLNTREVSELQAYKRLKERLPDTIFQVLFDSEVSDYIYRSGYKSGIRLSNSVNVWFGGQFHILVELTGRACSDLFNAGHLQAIMKETEEDANRVDVAIDIPGVTADSIIEHGYSKRIKALDVNKSSSGITYTIGSRTSERYTKVYEYYEPSERAGTARVEYTLKAKLAKQAARFYRYYGPGHVAAMANNTVKIRYMDKIDMPNIEEKFDSTTERSKSEERTLRWLKNAVAPAVRRLVVNGAIEPEELINLLLPNERQSRMFEDGK